MNTLSRTLWSMAVLEVLTLEDYLKVEPLIEVSFFFGFCSASSHLLMLFLVLFCTYVFPVGPNGV
jgi:hypothetical protein